MLLGKLKTSSYAIASAKLYTANLSEINFGIRSDVPSSSHSVFGVSYHLISVSNVSVVDILYPNRCSFSRTQNRPLVISSLIRTEVRPIRASPVICSPILARTWPYLLCLTRSTIFDACGAVSMFFYSVKRPNRVQMGGF